MYCHSYFTNKCHFNPSLAEHDMPYLSKQCRSALFVINCVNFYQKPSSSNLIGWKLEVCVALKWLQVGGFFTPLENLYYRMLVSRKFFQPFTMMSVSCTMLTLSITFLRKHFLIGAGNVSSKELWVLFPTEIIKSSFRYLIYFLTNERKWEKPVSIQAEVSF